MRSCSAWAASTLSHTVHDDPSDGDQEAQPKDRIHGVLPSTLPLDVDRLRSLVGLASAFLMAVLTVSPMNVPRSFVRYLTSNGLAMSWE